MERKMILAALYVLLSLLGKIWCISFDSYAINTAFAPLARLLFLG